MTLTILYLAIGIITVRICVTIHPKACANQTDLFPAALMLLWPVFWAMALLLVVARVITYSKES